MIDDEIKKKVELLKKCPYIAITSDYGNEKVIGGKVYYPQIRVGFDNNGNEVVKVNELDYLNSLGEEDATKNS